MIGIGERGRPLSSFRLGAISGSSHWLHRLYYLQVNTNFVMGQLNRNE
jgi:hypothetical protein